MFDRVRHLTDAGDDEADTAGSSPDVVVDSSLVPAALSGGHAQWAHRAHGVAVLDVDGADGRRLEQNSMDLAHNNLPSAGVIDDALNWMPCASLLYSLDANAVAESVQTLRWGLWVRS